MMEKSLSLNSSLEWGTNFLYGFIKPRSQAEDEKRHEFIITVVLFLTVLFSSIVTIITLADLVLHHKKYANPQSLVMLIAVTSGFVILYALARYRYHRLATVILLGLYFAAATALAQLSGVDNPQVLLLYALIIIISALVISSRSSIIMTLLIGFIIIRVGVMQQTGQFVPHAYFRLYPINTVEIIVYAVSLSIIMLVAWLSNREIDKSLTRARRAEHALKQERDLLEVKVEERTRELKIAQMEKLVNLYRFAEFGRLTSGLFHDLVNPLTSVSLNLEELNTKERSLMLERALEGTKRMVRFVDAARKQIQNQEVLARFNIVQEVEQVIEILSYKAKQEHIALILISPRTITYFGNPIKFHKLISNLIINAIDAYELANRRARHRVRITLKEMRKTIIITVQDEGSGIAPDHLARIFEPFFTTKSAESGTGIGLAISKEVVENDFKGAIQVESQVGHGTTFTVSLPLAKYE